MAFTAKDWRNLPDQTTPLNAVAMEDLETRLSTYTDGQITALTSRQVYNAKAASGIDSTGATDSSTAIATFYASIPAGSVAYFPKGIYQGLHAPGKQIIILGDGKHATEFRPPASVAASTNLVNFGTSLKCSLFGVKLNAQGNANVARGVNNTGNGNDKHISIRDNWFENFSATTGVAPHATGACAIYVWTCDSVSVKDNDFVDCIYSVLMDSPGPDCRVEDNKIWCTGSPGIGRTGIIMRRTSTAYSGSLVEGNVIENMRADPGDIGTEGHGIDLVKTQGVRVIGNATRDTNTAGIHVGGGSYGCKIIGNDIADASVPGLAGDGAGIYVELNIGTADTTLGSTGVRQSAVVSGNTVYNGNRYGISLSYSAGTIVTNNIIFENALEGIFTDSDRMVISANVVYNNFRADAAATPTSTPNVQAQIRVTVGQKCSITGNVIFDNKAAPTCDYGIAVANNTHILANNYATATVAPIYEQSGGATNTVVTNPGYVTANGGSATVAHAGTIAHGLAKAPTRVSVNSTVAGHIVGISAVDATNITVILTDAAGTTVGIAEAVRWSAVA